MAMELSRFGQTPSSNGLTKTEKSFNHFVANLLMENMGPIAKDMIDLALPHVSPGRGIKDTNTFLITLLNKVRLGLMPLSDPNRANSGFYISADYTLVHPTDIIIDVYKRERGRCFLPFCLQGTITMHTNG